jgi:hypothetical protein
MCNNFGGQEEFKILLIARINSLPDAVGLSTIHNAYPGSGLVDGKRCWELPAARNWVADYT